MSIVELDDQITLTTWDGVRELRAGETSNLRPEAEGGLVLRDVGETAEYTDPFGAGTPVTYERGRWTSPVVETGYLVGESVSSWNVHTPTGTWVEIEFRGRKTDGTWTTWFVLGRWTSGAELAPADGGVGVGDIHRTSVPGQTDADADLLTDTFVAKPGREPDAFQTRVTLYRPEGASASPRLDSVHTMTNERLPASRYTGTSDFTIGHEVVLDVPRYSQNIHRGEYPELGGGGQVWCSPTSSAMVIYSYGHEVPESELAGIEAPNGDPQVDHAARHTWDHAYEGTGNWSFNAAYASAFGLDSFVTRLRSLAEAEKFVQAGIPLILSVSFDEAEMPEAGYGTNGHLVTLVGFTAEGDPVINDPNRASNAAVRSVYARENFERVWQTSADGLTYVYHPRDVPLPRNLPGVTPNW